MEFSRPKKTLCQILHSVLSNYPPWRNRSITQHKTPCIRQPPRCPSSHTAKLPSPADTEAMHGIVLLRVCPRTMLHCNMSVQLDISCEKRCVVSTLSPTSIFQSICAFQVLFSNSFSSALLRVWRIDTTAELGTLQSASPSDLKATSGADRPKLSIPWLSGNQRGMICASQLSQAGVQSARVWSFIQKCHNCVINTASSVLGSQLAWEGERY